MSVKTVKVSPAKMIEIDKTIRLIDLSDGKIIYSFFYENKEYVATSARGTGKGRGWEQIEARQIIDESLYCDLLKPLVYAEHFADVEKGNRDRSFYGMLSKFGKRKVVFTDEKIIFIPGSEDVQLELFKN